MEVQSEIVGEIKEHQATDKFLQEKLVNEPDRFKKGEDDLIRYEGRLCVPNKEKLKEKILTEGHASPLSVHPGGDKLYQNLRTTYRWSGMQKDAAKLVSKCLICQKVKSEHQRPQGKIQPLEIPMWKWESI